MLQYIDHVILPFGESMRGKIGDDKAALVIINNFTGQVTESVMSLLESNNVCVCLLPPNMTNVLQPMDIAVNKSAKEFIKGQFEQWYAEVVIKQLDRKDRDGLETAEIQPVDLSV